MSRRRENYSGRAYTFPTPVVAIDVGRIVRGVSILYWRVRFSIVDTVSQILFVLATNGTVGRTPVVTLDCRTGTIKRPTDFDAVFAFDINRFIPHVHSLQICDMVPYLVPTVNREKLYRNQGVTPTERPPTAHPLVFLLRRMLA